jgi:hypothetical protein
MFADWIRFATDDERARQGCENEDASDASHREPPVLGFVGFSAQIPVDKGLSFLASVGEA